MLFRRRTPADFGERVRTVVWPRRSFVRSAKYFSKRILRLRATPHAIAAGVAAGVFVAFLPIPGLHLIIAAVAAWLIAGNIVASALGTAAIGNPLTFPLIWGSTYAIGQLILHGHEPGAAKPPHIGHLLHHLDLSQLWQPLLEPMTVGAIPLGLLFAAISYAVTRWAVSAFQTRRRARLAEKARHAAKADPRRDPAVLQS
jgi:uncharacterized protein (DUF2062 family)